MTYIIKAFWPPKLCILYPLPAELPVWPAIGSALLLAAITCLVFYHQTRFRWLLVGWLWFLITLVPVIGLVQVGNQAMADRYAYVPLIGLFLAAAWGVNYLIRPTPLARLLGLVATFIFLFSCLILTKIQLIHWRNNIALFTQAITATKNNATAHSNLGMALANAGRKAEALEQYEEAVRINPNDPEAQYQLGLELMDAEKFKEAQLHFSAALKQETNNVILLNSLGVAMAAAGSERAAAIHFERAIELNPEYPKSYLNYATVLQKLNQNGAAFTNFSRALQLEPDWPEALEKMASFLAACPDSAWHKPSEAIKLSQRANEITHYESPNHLEILAMTYAINGDFSNAVSWAEIAVKKAKANNLKPIADRIAGELIGYQTGKILQFSIPSASALEKEKRPDHQEPEH